MAADKKMGFLDQWLGLINDQDELERLAAEEQAKKAAQNSEDEDEDKTKSLTPPKPPVSLFSIIVGRSIAIIYGGVVVMLAMTGAALGLLVTLGVPSPLTFAIISGCISAYINVTAFWSAAPQLIDDIVNGRIFKKITNGEEQKEYTHWTRWVAIGFVTIFMASIAAGVAISSELHAMTMADGALEALGLGALFGISGVILPVLVCMGFMAYWILYSKVSASVLRETNFKNNLKQKLRYLFCIDKDESLLLPGEKMEDAPWIRLRAFIRMIIFLAVIVTVIWATGGFAILGIGYFLGILGATGGTAPIMANVILPYVATFIMGAWAASVNFHFITLIVLGLQYAGNQYVSPMAGIKSSGWRFAATLLGTITLILPAVLVLRGLWGFIKAEGRYIVSGLKEGLRVYNEGPGFSFNSVFESARMKTAYKPWSGMGNISYNLVLGTRNLIWNTGLAIMSTPLLFIAFPVIGPLVTSILAGVNKFLSENRKIFAVVNASNNAALIGGDKPMMLFGGFMQSGAFGADGTKKEALFSDKTAENTVGGPAQKPSATASTSSPVLVQKNGTGSERHSVKMVQNSIPPGARVDVITVPSATYDRHIQGRIHTQMIKAETYTVPRKDKKHETVRASVYTDLKHGGNPSLSIAAAQACVVSARVPGQKLNIDGDDKQLVLDAFKVCIANKISFIDPPQSPMARAALVKANAATIGPEYILRNYQTTQPTPYNQTNKR